MSEEEPTTISSPLSNNSKVNKPDEAHYESLIKDETNAIEALRTKIADLDHKAAQYMGGRDEFIRQRGIQRSRINDITHKINAFVDERSKLLENSTRNQEQGRNLRGLVEQMQRNIGFDSIEEIDKKIYDIQYNMMVSSLSLNEEKRLIAEMEKLRKMKPELAKLADLEEQAQYVEGTDGPRSRLDVIRDELTRLRDARRDESDRLSVLQEERNKQEEPLRDLREQRDSLRRTMGQHQTRVSQLQSERRVKETEWRAYQARLRSARIGVERWERQKNQLDSDKKLVHDELASLSEGTFDWKSMLAVQVIGYMKAQISQYETALKQASNVESEESPVEDDEIELEETGVKVRPYQRKKCEAFVVGNNKKKGKRGKKPAKKREVPSDRLQHTMETIRDFSSLGFDKEYPLTIGDCPEAILKLNKIVEAQKEKNLAHQEIIERKREKLQSRLKELELREVELMADKKLL